MRGKTEQADPAPTAVSDVVELLSLAELTGVVYFEISGRRETEDRPESGSYQISVEHRLAETELWIRFKLEMTSTDAGYVIDVATIYTFSKALTITTDLIEEFVEKVASMAAFPYLREGLATTAARLEVAVPILGILRQGEFKIGETQGERQAS